LGRRVFIDAGANQGQSIEAFLKEFPEAEKYDIHAFEPGIPFLELVNNYGDLPGIKLYRKAVWITDGPRPFFQDYDSVMGGSTLLLEKGLPRSNLTVAHCIHFSEWLKGNMSPQDEIILKMDIEGAEYSVLQDLVVSGTVDLIDKIFCELHGAKCGKSFQQTIDLIRLLGAVGHKLHIWEATTFGYEKHEDRYYTVEYMEKEFEKWFARGIYVD